MTRQQNWRASRYGQRNVIEQPLPNVEPRNRDLAVGAVPDPYGLSRRPVKVVIDRDVLDRLLQAKRIGPGQYAAGRCFQRLLEIHLGGAALEGGGVRTASRDDLLARILERSAITVAELQRIRERIGWRSERLLKTLLIELNPNTRRAWTFDELVNGDRRKAYALSERVCEALEDLSRHWGGVSLD